jgi:hypothetical protein
VCGGGGGGGGAIFLPHFVTCFTFWSLLRNLDFPN